MSTRPDPLAVHTDPDTDRFAGLTARGPKLAHLERISAAAAWLHLKTADGRDCRVSFRAVGGALVMEQTFEAG